MLELPKSARFDALVLRDLLLEPFDRHAWTLATGPKLHLRIGNEPPTIEREAALDQLADFTARVDAFGRGFCDVWRRREVIYVETDVQHANCASIACHIPCALIARTFAGLIQDLRFHLDPTPLYADVDRAPFGGRGEQWRCD